VRDRDSKLIEEAYKKIVLKEYNDEYDSEESELDKIERIKNEKFPWAEEMEEKNSDTLNSIVYIPEEDKLSYSIAFLPDFVKKKDAIEFAKRIFPDIKKGMDFYTKDPTGKGHPVKEILGDELKDYDIAIDNVDTGYWDLSMSIKNASNESPNKLISAFNAFYKAVEYLKGEEDEFLSSLGIE
jgi:hypothetical protein